MRFVDCARLMVDMSEKNKKVRTTYFIAPRMERVRAGQYNLPRHDL